MDPRYITSSEYAELSTGKVIPTDQLEKCLAYAEHDIDGLTFNRIVQREFSTLTQFQQNLVKRAVCLQADFHHEYDDMLNNPLSSYGINGVSMSFDNNKIICYSGIYTTSGIYALLRQTGLTYRGVML